MGVSQVKLTIGRLIEKCSINECSRRLVDVCLSTFIEVDELCIGPEWHMLLHLLCIPVFYHMGFDKLSLKNLVTNVEC